MRQPLLHSDSVEVQGAIQSLHYMVTCMNSTLFRRQ